MDTSNVAFYSEGLALDGVFEMIRYSVFAFLAVSICSLPMLEAKGPKGNRGWGGRPTTTSRRFQGNSNGIGARVVQGAADAGRTVANGVGRGLGKVSERLTGRNQAVAVQRANEQRQLQHRQATAQKLREISDRNGNENLKTVADKMDQRALDQFDKRNQKIDQLNARHNPTDLTQPNRVDGLNPADNGINDFSAQDQRRLLQEEQKLMHQLEVAQQLRDLAARNGNQNLIETADRMELMAAERYANQVRNVTPTEQSLSTTPDQPGGGELIPQLPE